MATQIMWNGFSWGFDSSVVRSVENLSTNRGINIERNEDKEGQPATQTVALELVNLSFEYTLMAAAGCNPRKEYEAINECPGVHASLYLNGSKFLANEMMLRKVSASDYVLDGKGRIVSMKVSVEFEEYAVDASGLKRDKIVKKSALRPGVSKKPTSKSALKVGASSSQKAARAKKNKQMKR